MKITAKVDVYCASGFYCMRNGEKKCSRLQFEKNMPYCEVFYPFLDTDRYGNVLKCKDCLLAEREARLKQNDRKRHKRIDNKKVIYHSKEGFNLECIVKGVVIRKDKGFFIIN